MFRKLILASAVSLAISPGGAWSLGLGGIRTQSALSEPFAGEIELYDVVPDELDTVKVTIAPEAEFAKVGSSRPPFLSQLRFSPQATPSGQTIIRVDSREPIREPYLDFLIEVIWPDGRLVKGYTVLLDPPVTLARSARRIEPVRTERRAPSAAPVQPVTSPVPRDAAGYPLRYGPVPAGEGLWRIAREMQPRGATVAQTAMALYRNNQQAFIRGDINKLRLGAELEIPTPEELFALDSGAADSEFRRALRGERVTATPLTDISRSRQPADRLEIAAAPTPTAPEAEEVRPPRAPERAEPQLGALERDLLLVQESTESTRQETGELRARVRELETQLADIRRLLELRNQQLAQLQASGAAARGEPSEAELSDRPLESEPLPIAGEGPEELGEPIIPETDEPALPDRADAGLERPDEAPSAGAGVLETPEEPAAVDTLSAEAGEEAIAEADVEAGEPEAPAVSEDRDTGEQPFWHTVPPSTLGLAVGVPALLLLLGILVVRRRKRMEEGLQSEGLAVDESALRGAVPAPESGAGAAAGVLRAGVEGTEVSSNLSAPYSGFGDLDEETDDADIISEADVYIAYGRYREAESLLAEELKTSPERLELKFKLAEAYFGAKNAVALDGLISELRAAGADTLHPEQWQRLSSMSRELSGSGTPSVEPSDLALTPSSRSAPEVHPGRMEEEWPTRGESASGEGDLRLSGFLDEEPESRQAPQAPVPPPLEGSLNETHKPADVSGREPTQRNLNIDLEDLGALTSELELPAEDSAATPTGSDSELQLEDLEDLSELDLGKPDSRITPPSAEQPAAGGSAGAQPESLGGASLESLDITPTGKDSVASDVLSSQWQMDSGLWDEVATKIDLARAYMEMEDPDAARVILEEVIAEGTEEQKTEAREMLSRLD
jgi:pilus assembly protein FimV